MKPEEVEGFMHSFNIGTVISTAVHEAYPGHYIQFLVAAAGAQPGAQAAGREHRRRGLGALLRADDARRRIWPARSRERRTSANPNSSGSASLQDALLRNARFIVGIQMHTGKMSFDQAVEFFEKEGYQSKETATVETKRGTSDPTYLYYTLGKLEIMKLREDMKKKQGAAFSLEEFHNDFLRQGFPPIKIVREALLGDASPTL
jgi:uncharacterized protein (DUF885 family)